MRIVTFTLAVALLCGLLMGCRSKSSRAGAAEDKSPIIVEINGDAEHQAAFERFVKARLSDFTSQNTLTQTDNDQLRSRLFDEFVQRQLIVQEADKKKIEPTDDEIRTALEAQHKQTNGAGGSGNSENPDQNAVAMESGERRIEIYNDLITLKFYRTEVLKDVKVTPQEIEQYYNDNKAVYQGKNGFYVREIRVNDEAEAQKVYRQSLAKPDDFAVLAKQHSKAPTAAGGGLIYYEAQQLPPVLEQAITPLKVGSISKVVKSNYGFHIFKLEQRGEAQPLEKVRKEIEDKLLSRKNQALIEEFNKRALGGAKIKIYRDKLSFNYGGSLNAGS
ncbi:MAG TPA: peptidyl-prolyl cis-trans isomerase [Blastocatellia bacterium]|nr:peptidyl-prolyl cis-trans isomerase [Blastocatellia bacterium]HMV82972.1 peptidyl-prolyl cis-trans isomerase [Blastocatellia bacterium]HMX27110.1 peptidyl-prolyl cis-trans isomerase [Blastocatellia bacterium]HMY71488.1 peptidyl-prolyl cis-trans isomerase [Blastocatellia bacterium]HMZ17627.1 peptidyl-prolyl cis-trans isomerase [Blastocatellia bacterium]